MLITHRWGGPLGVPRDWRPAFGIDDQTGIAFAGGHAGEGVAASHLVGSALAELLCDRPSELSETPFLQSPHKTLYAMRPVFRKNPNHAPPISNRSKRRARPFSEEVGTATLHSSIGS